MFDERGGMLPYKRDKIEPFNKLFFCPKKPGSRGLVSLPGRRALTTVVTAQPQGHYRGALTSDEFVRSEEAAWGSELPEHSAGDAHLGVLGPLRAPTPGGLVRKRQNCST